MRLERIIQNNTKFGHIRSKCKKMFQFFQMSIKRDIQLFVFKMSSEVYKNSIWPRSDAGHLQEGKNCQVSITKPFSVHVRKMYIKILEFFKY